jgi:hypothetical protein
MAKPIVDQVLKEMTERYAEQIIRLVFPGEKFQVVFSKLDKELTIKTRLTDRVIMLDTAGGKRLLHLEFQLRYNRKIPERLFVYSGALTAKYQMKVASFLFLIKPSQTVGDFGVYSSDLFGKTTNEFSFPVIHLWKLREAILSGDKRYRIFASLLLEIEPKPDVGVLRQVRDIINLETNAQRRAEYFSFAIPIARRHFGLAVIQSIFKEADMINIEWEKIPHFGDAIKAKKKEARQEGRQEALQEMLIEILNAQFGHVPGRTVRAIQSIQEPRKLKSLARKSLKAESLAEVQKLLAASKTKVDGRNGKKQLANLQK